MQAIPVRFQENLVLKHMALLLLASVLSACNNGLTEKSKVEAVINDGLQKNPPCDRVAVGPRGRLPRVDNSTVPDLLVASGYAEKATVEMVSLWSNKKEMVEGYNLTAKGEKLVTIQGSNMEYPCIRKGVWKVQSIEAIDAGVDAIGKNVANVRARILFYPEDWLAATRTSTYAGAVKYWTSIEKMESQQWMYQLVKSGDAFFFTQLGTPVN